MKISRQSSFGTTPRCRFHSGLLSFECNPDFKISPTLMTLIDSSAPSLPRFAPRNFGWQKKRPTLVVPWKPCAHFCVTYQTELKFHLSSIGTSLSHSGTLAFDTNFPPQRKSTFHRQPSARRTLSLNPLSLGALHKCLDSPITTVIFFAAASSKVLRQNHIQ